MEERLRRWMSGRWGPDELSRDLVRTGLGILLLGLVLRKPWISGFALILTVYAWFRILSKNRAARAVERNRYLPVRRKITAPFFRGFSRLRSLRTHRMFTCDACGTRVRVPRGKGRIRIRCPQCEHRFEKKT